MITNTKQKTGVLRFETSSSDTVSNKLPMKSIPTYLIKINYILAYKCLIEIDLSTDVVHYRRRRSSKYYNIAYLNINVAYWIYL